MKHDVILPPYGEFKSGWRVLLASFLGMGVCVSSLVFYSAGIWIRPWQAEFGWSRAEIGAASTFGTVTLVAGAPFAAALIDRFGIRNVVTVSLLLFALGLFAISRMDGGLPLFYGLSALYGLVGVASSPLAFTRAINGSFARNRGAALGLALTSTGVAGVLLPRLLAPFVQVHGWRTGYAMLAATVVVVTPLVYGLLRDLPGQSAAKVAGEPGVSPVSGMALREAARTRAFWTLGLVFLAVAIAVGGLIPAFIPLLQDGGLTAAEAGRYGAVIGASVIFGRLATGFLIDRIFAAYVTCAAFILVAAGLLALAVGGLGFAGPGAVALGFAIGCEVDLIGYFVARYFGLRKYGLVYSVLYGLFMVGCGVSPILVGHIWDVTGTYALALKGAAALLAGAGALALTLPRFADDA